MTVHSLQISAGTAIPVEVFEDLKSLAVGPTQRMYFVLHPSLHKYSPFDVGAGAERVCGLPVKWDSHQKKDVVSLHVPSSEPKYKSVNLLPKTHQKIRDMQQSIYETTGRRPSVDEVVALAISDFLPSRQESVDRLAQNALDGIEFKQKDSVITVELSQESKNLLLEAISKLSRG